MVQAGSDIAGNDNDDEWNDPSCFRHSLTHSLTITADYWDSHCCVYSIPYQ